MTETILDRIMRTVAAAVSLLIPFIYFPPFADPFQLPKETLFRAGLLTLLGLWLWRALKGGRISIPSDGVLPPLLFLNFIALLSIFQAPNMAEASGLVLDLILASLALVLVLPSLEGGGQILADCLAASACLTALLGALQLLMGPRFPITPPTQGGAFSGDVTISAISVSLVLPLLVTRLLSAGGFIRWLWAAGTGVAGGFLILARTRSAWLGGAAGLLLLALWAVRQRRIPRLFDGAVAGAVGIALLLALGGHYGAGISPLSAPPSFKVVALQGRELSLATWRSTFRLVLTHPLGVGAANWRYLLPVQAAAGEPNTPLSPERLPAQAGNEYLESAAELGLAGLFFGLWLFRRLLASGWRRFGTGGRGIPEGAAAGLAGLAASGLLSSPLREQPTAWMCLILASFLLAPRLYLPGASIGAPARVLALEASGRRRGLLVWLTCFAFLALLALGSWDGYRELACSASLHRGQVAFLRKDYASALSHFLHAGRVDPSSYPARYWAGKCAFETRQYDLAESEFRAAVKMSPYDAPGLIALASVLKEKGSLTDAVAIADKARKLWPRNPPVLLRVGEIKQAAGDLQGALEAYGTALIKDPDSAEVHLHLGALVEADRQLAKAIREYERVIELDPGSFEGNYRLGSAYLKQGRFEDAQKALARALARVPNDVPTLLRMGQSLAGQQHYCDAVETIRKAREAEPSPGRRAAIDEALRNLSAKCPTPPAVTPGSRP